MALGGLAQAVGVGPGARMLRLGIPATSREKIGRGFLRLKFSLFLSR